MSEARTTAFFSVYHPKGPKVNFTVRGGTTSSEVWDDLQVIFDAVDQAQETGFFLNASDAAAPATGEVVEGKEIVDNRDAFAWVRGVSRNGSPVLYAYAEHEMMENKNVTAYAEMIELCPITQEEWDNAKVWESDTAPTKTRAIEGGYLNYFPHEVNFGMYDTGKTFTLTSGERTGEVVPILRPITVSGTPGGVKVEDPRSKSKRPAPSSKTPINNTGRKCPDCNAPDGKPHATSCKTLNGPSDPAAIPGVKKGVPLPKPPAPPSPAVPHARDAAAIIADITAMGSAMYGDEWEATIRTILERMGNKNLLDVPAAGLRTIEDNLKEGIDSFIWQYVDLVGWDLDGLHAAVKGFGFKNSWNDLTDLPADILVKVLTDIRNVYEDAGRPD